ncbi:MAG: hypothetical protein AB1782_03875 [Cyanobacteriota bacterium]
MTDTIGANHSINSLNLSSYKNEFGNLCIKSHTNVPESHKRIADSYVLVRRVFGTPVVHSSLTEEEKKLLVRFDFCPLEYTTSKQMEQELEFLRKWSNEREETLRAAADSIVLVRSKELKHLIATNYVSVKRELYDGYKVLDRYFQEISKYNRK